MLGNWWMGWYGAYQFLSIKKGNSMKRILMMLSICLSLSALEQSEIPLYGRLSPRNMRYSTFQHAMQLMQERNVRVLVETGCARLQGQEAFYGDGASSVIFGHWASLHNAHLYSVDISAKNIANAQDLTKAYAPYISFTVHDSVEYLRAFDQQIDFLYLDSFDFEASDPEPSQLHHLKEIQVAYDKLAPNAIVMIDDCALPHGGKGKYAIQFLVERGWHIVAKKYQVILSR